MYIKTPDNIKPELQQQFTMDEEGLGINHETLVFEWVCEEFLMEEPDTLEVI